MPDFTVTLTLLSFFLTIAFIFWRPKGWNEAIPSSLGAILVLLSGSVSWADLNEISSKVSGAAVTIIATIVMGSVLESIGFFRWTAEKIAVFARSSGIRLFWYVNLLCFLMTLLFNNDGSIIITTPILLLLLKKFGIKPHQKLPYLISGALVATASSAPIGVSNIVNLIAIKIVGIDLYLQTEMMFVPATLGLLVMLLLLFASFYKVLPRRISVVPHVELNPAHGKDHPLKPQLTTADTFLTSEKQSKMMRNILIFVFVVRASLFAASFIGIPVSLVAVIGSLILLGWRWYYFKISPGNLLKKAPWQIFIFAFGMYVIIFGLHKIGLTNLLIYYLKPYVSGNMFHASLIMGLLITIMSNLFNNHPALMVGTLTLTNMGLPPEFLKVAYLSNVIGSDIGSLVLPIGTLATLIWMHILRQHKIKIDWKYYTKVTLLVIPPTVLFTLICLYYWIHFVF